MPTIPENQIRDLYDELRHTYGPQGWWPLHALISPENPGGYHPGIYDLPVTREQRFEIASGAILTQNVNWQNAARAIEGLHQQLNVFSPESLLRCPIPKIEAAIRPAGYFRQKAKKLIILARWFAEYDATDISRDSLLSLWGIGPETADSILLYAYHQPCFVIDNYSSRIFALIGIIERDYHRLQSIIVRALAKNTVLYQEFHALLVRHAKAIGNKSRSNP